MSEGLRPKPRWFRLAFRALAVAIPTGFAGNVAHELYGLPMSHAVLMGFGMVAIYGSMAFVILEWVGAWLGYVKPLDAMLYLMLFVVLGCGGTLALHR